MKSSLNKIIIITIKIIVIITFIYATQIQLYSFQMRLEFYNRWLEKCEMFRRARAPVELNGEWWYGFKWYPALLSYPDLTLTYGEK